MSNIIELSNIIAKNIIEVSKEHGIIITLLAFVGLFSLIGAMFNKAWQAFRILFMTFIVAPLILVFSLINKSKRKQRIKEIGEIKAFVKEHPDRWKKLMYYILFLALVLTIFLVAYFLASEFLTPFYELNRYSKTMLNVTLNATNVSNP